LLVITYMVSEGPRIVSNSLRIERPWLTSPPHLNLIGGSMSTLRHARSAYLLILAATSVAFAYGKASPPDHLKITILDGDNAFNNTKLRTAREVIVQIEDENENRVPGAVVIFSLPSHGPGGTFLNGSSTLTVPTDAQGRAVARGFRPNSLSGDFEIRVNVSHQGKTGRAIVHQRNFVPKGAAAGLSAKWITIIAGVGAGAAVGVVAASRGGKSSGNSPSPPPPPSITLTPGGGAVGPPR
jgi:hypothetical protein